MKHIFSLVLILVGIENAFANKNDPVAIGPYRPSYIIVIRHGEKHKDRALTQLSEKGRERARALAEWVSVRVPDKLTGGDKIVAIYAPEPRDNTVDQRPLLTAMPSAFENQLPLFSPANNQQSSLLWLHITNNPLVHDKPILIVWEHTCIQELMKVLGFKVPYWEDDNFSRVYIIHKDQYTVTCQNLLVGDDTACRKPLVHKHQPCKNT